MGKVKVKSPTGIVHYADEYKTNNYLILCGSINYYDRFTRRSSKWKKTDEPVTCKICLKMKLLGELRDTKFHARIIHNDVRQGVELSLEYAKGNLLRTLISQGYIKKIPKKGEQIEITIWL